MQRLGTGLWVVLILAIGSAPRTWAADPLASVAIMEVHARGGVSAEQTEALSDLLAQEIDRLGCYQVVTKTDIVELLKLEERKLSLGCDDMGCLAEIGGALGVRWMVTGSVSRLGDAFLVNLKLIDVSQVKITSRVSRNVGRDQRALVPGIRALARQLIVEARGLPKPKQYPARYLDFSIELEPLEGAPVNPYPWILFGGGLAVAAAGGVTGGLAWAQADRSEPFATVKAYDDWSDQVATKGMAADVLMGVGGALVVSGVIWLIVDAVSEPDEGEAAAPAAAGPIPGGGLSAEVRF